MNKTLMILGASILQVPAIEKAKEMGLNVIVLDLNPNAIGFSHKGIVKEVISTTDIPSAIEIAKKYKIDGVMTLASDMPVKTVAAVAKELNLVGVSLDTANKTTDKSKMRKALDKANVPIPSYFRVSNIDELREAIKQMPSDFIIKPVDSSGSRGVIKVDNRKDVVNAYEYSKKQSRDGVVIVEEYMSGPEISVETIAFNGVIHVIQITDKITTGAPHYVELGHTQPTRLECIDEIKTVAIEANKALGILNGPSHTEIIVTEEGPKIVEVGARLGGDCITTHLVPLSTGVNMVEACINIALGKIPDVTATLNCGSAIRYFHQPIGKVSNIIGLDNAKQIPGVQQVNIVHGIGEEVGEIIDSNSRMGFVIAQGKDSYEASQRAESAVKCITIQTL